MNETNNFYQAQLTKSNIAKKYLDRRLIKDSIIEKFQLGYSGSSSNQLYLHLKNKGLNLDDALSLGLIKKSNNREGEYYDFFRNRLIFPIKDYRSQIIAFGGRALDNSNIKYINSTDSPLFKKSYNLFNLNLAIEENRKVQNLIIVEGYMDVISLYQNNFKTAVAPLGTALTSFQIEKAWKVCQSPIVIFDGDEAGQKAAERASLLAIQNLQPDLSLRFSILPKNYDPDDFINKNSAADFTKLLDQSLSLSEFLWRKELEREDISTPEKKAGFEKRIRTLLSKINNQTVREYYNKEFTEKIRLLKDANHNINKGYKTYYNKKVSNEIKKSERVDLSSHDSAVREKIIILFIIENPFLIYKYTEEFGKIRFNDLKLSKLTNKILEFSSSHADKDLENFDFKAYLLSQSLDQEINFIYQPNLISTYGSLIKSEPVSVEKNFLGLVELHSKLVDENDLTKAFADLEQNMDQESFENFVKIKNESLIKN